MEWQSCGDSLPAAASLRRGLLVLLCSQQVSGQLSDVLPGPLHVGELHGAGTDSKAQHELVPEVAGNQVDFLGSVDSFQKILIQFVGTLQTWRQGPCSGPRGLSFSWSPRKAGIWQYCCISAREATLPLALRLQG